MSDNTEIDLDVFLAMMQPGAKAIRIPVIFDNPKDVEGLSAGDRGHGDWMIRYINGEFHALKIDTSMTTDENEQ